jgi:hypothetical protein
MDAHYQDKDYQPAFPVDIKNERFTAFGPGLSKREYVAIKAMQGYIASFAGSSHDPKPENVAKKAVEYADALLAELDK